MKRPGDCALVWDRFSRSAPSSRRPGPAAWPRCREASCMPTSGRCLFRSRPRGSGRPCPAAPTPSCNSLPLSASPPPACPERTEAKTARWTVNRARGGQKPPMVSVGVESILNHEQTFSRNSNKHRIQFNSISSR